MQVEILKKVVDEVGKGKKACLVFITEVKGSVPGANDSMMAVFEDGQTFGTIGGGPMEYEVTKKAIEAIKNEKDDSFDLRLNKSSDLNMICGGENKGYIKVFMPQPQLIIYGAGHVGQKLARVAVRTGFDVTVVDPREEFKDKEDFIGIKKFLAMDSKEANAYIDFSSSNTYLVICTTNSDKEVLTNVLGKDYKYIGMIGSRHKIKLVFDDLKERGIDQKYLDQIYTPIGFDIDNGKVEEIAISIISQILAVKNNKYKEFI
ncbi:MAG: XdhC/CoxI family protein [Peptoniphilaceae bacterium]|nr:XdhC/CoxI family protein [Peptoniphilaceae bacterium]MDY6018725.1 XdhC/CoxI family protein [Anaerococcus sp.]